MRPGAHVQAAIDVMQDIEQHHQPAARALSEWGYTHRFAGSRDRAVIGNLVYDTLRNRAAAAWKMGEDTGRALVLGTLSLAWNRSIEDIGQLCDGSKYCPAVLSDEEREGLGYVLSKKDPLWVRANFPEWLMPSLERVFGDRLLDEGIAIAKRAPIDLRANTLLVDRERILKTFEKQHYAVKTPHSTIGVRVPLPNVDQRPPNLEVSPEHGKGYFEIQDEGSQIAARMCDARAGNQVLDYCAGAGGKTLALAAAMENQGQLYAYDSDPHRLRPIFDRLKRAQVRNVQVLKPGDKNALQSLMGRMDIVLADAPCSGTGTWRRRPDAKWRLSQRSLAARLQDQKTVLDEACEFVRPGGRLVYVTCSVLPEENEDQIAAFLDRHPNFEPLPFGRFWWGGFKTDPIQSALPHETPLQLTPGRHGTDGFFISILGAAKAQPQTPTAPTAFSWDE